MAEERNINYSYQTNLWGNINYKQLTNFNEWFMGDFDDSYYFQDYDKVLRYYAGAGFKGIELMIFNVPTIINIFGSMKNFKEFANERGIEKISGMFSHHIGSEDKRNHKAIFQLERQRGAQVFHENLWPTVTASTSSSSPAASTTAPAR